MRQRGRKSGASLTVVPISTKDRRPPPPAHLDTTATKLWKAIVADSPSGWFNVAQESLLAGFCCHASAANFISGLIEKERPTDFSDPDKLRRYSRLLAMRIRETTAMSALATRMRLTQQSQIQPRTAGRAWDCNDAGTKPWDR